MTLSITHRRKLFFIFICLIIGIFITINGLDLVPAKEIKNNKTFDLPYNIHLNWQHDPSNTITIIWETTTLTTNSIVKYGLNTNYNQIAIGTTDNQGTNGLIHIVEITELIPGTTYHFICGDNMSGWSFDSTFMTMPTDMENFTFCAMGDSRDNPNEFNKIVEKTNNINPAFTVFTGDLCSTDNENSYDQWFSNWEQLGNHSPIAPSLGNHEGIATNYLHRFALPNNERWYSFNYSNMHIIVLSTSLDVYLEGSIQYNWLLNDLKLAINDTAHPWKIINFHNPPYNVGGHGGDPIVQNTLSPLFSQYKVDLVLNGHNHYYERTFPLKGGGANPTVTDTNLLYYKNPTGVIYVTTGSCGAPLYNIGSAYYLAIAQKTYHFARINIYSNNSLHMETFLDDGTTLIDEFWIEKTTGQNLPPEEPLIEGPAQGKSGVLYQFKFSTIDPDKDNISYLIDWGDNTSSDWIGPYSSGYEINLSHKWIKNETYTIKAKAKDISDNESNWAQRPINIPKNIGYNNSLFLELIEHFIKQLKQVFPLIHYLMYL